MADDEEGAEMAAEVESWAIEARAGRPVEWSEFEDFEWQLLLIWHTWEARYEAAHRGRITALIQGMQG